MGAYQYRAADRTGKVVEGVLESEAEAGVVTRLHDMGLIPLRISVPGERLPGAFGKQALLFARKGTSPRQLLQFTQELSALLTAGLPLDRSLGVLANLVEGDQLRKVIRLLLEGVRAGKSLSAAMTEHPDVFPRLYINMVRAGESGGMLESVLRHLVDYLTRALELKEDIRSALTYPLVVVGVGALSLGVLFFFVIPKFSLLFRDVHQALPWLSKLLLDFSQGLTDYGWILLLGVLVGGVGVAFGIRNPEGRLYWDDLRLRSWVVGDLLRKLEVARFARTLSALLRGGVPLLEALGTVEGVVNNRIVARALLQVQSKVREGKGMAGPLSETKIFPPLALHMIAVGEETGKLEGMLNNVADHFDEEVKRTTKRLTALLEPALILAMGVVIGIVVLSMLMAILSIYDLPA
jgi:general secretion pathway protein F